MNRQPLSTKDYPVAEKSPEQVMGQRGRTIDQLTLDAVMQRELDMEDLRITPVALSQQAEIARAAGRGALAENFVRAAEMTRLPKDEIMRVYELLRPGRVQSKEAILEAARYIETKYNTPILAMFLREAADRYERRGLFRTRF